MRRHDRVGRPDYANPVPPDQTQAGQHGGRPPAYPTIRLSQYRGIFTMKSEVPARVQGECPVYRCTGRYGADAGGIGFFVCTSACRQNYRIPSAFGQVFCERQQAKMSAAQCARRKVEADHENTVARLRVHLVRCPVAVCADPPSRGERGVAAATSVTPNPEPFVSSMCFNRAHIAMSWKLRSK